MIKDRKIEARMTSETRTVAQLMVIYFLVQLGMMAEVRRLDASAIKSLLWWDGVTPTQPGLFDGNLIDRSGQGARCGAVLRPGEAKPVDARA
ncbi:hypothetical protein [Bradyrhizobium sp. STM 3562]|uniref:hypothetical protein n=1 Tax=Bradyrhizobium sp. STM 3562 TaxID=578924 RepID=UPI00388FC053